MGLDPRTDPRRDEAEVERLLTLAEAESLSAMELRCLQVVSHGVLEPELGEMLGISRAAAKNHLRLARRRLAAKNTAHAVAIALRWGIIE